MSGSPRGVGPEFNLSGNGQLYHLCFNVSIFCCGAFVLLSVTEADLDSVAV